MPRVKVGVTAHRRHKKILKLAKGYKGSKSKQFKKANETRCGPHERHLLQPSRLRPHEGWRRSQPQDAR